jgi:hypothetical protein
LASYIYRNKIFLKYISFLICPCAGGNAVKLIFISYKKLSYIILFSFLSAVAVFIFYSSARIASLNITAASAIISTVEKYRTLHIDTDGNGKKDTIAITLDSTGREYLIDIINDDGQKFSLSPKSGSRAVGQYIAWWPLQITVADINLDSMPEIITQVSGDGHEFDSCIFRWKDDGYMPVLTGSWQGISLYDIDKDMVPEIVAEEDNDGNRDTYTVYAWTREGYSRTGLKPLEDAAGYSKIKSLMRLINSPMGDKLPGPEVLSAYFTDEWLEDSRNMESLSDFTKDITGVQLQDYIGEELESGKKKGSKPVLWRLRYIIYRKTDTGITTQNCTAEVETIMTGGSNKEYKIRSIRFRYQ